MQWKPIIHRDQVHGDVRYDPLSVELLNTKAMQRLGRVHQLGYSHLVFRGGTHTRLAHVLGAASMGMTIVEKLQLNYSQRRATYTRHVVEPEMFLPGLAANGASINDRWDVLRHLVCWAALLHDLAHVPLGHTLEDEFEGLFEKHDDFGSPRASYLWGESGEICSILKNENLFPPSFRRCKIAGHRVWQTVLLICYYKERPEGFQKYVEEEARKAQSALESPDTPELKRKSLERKLTFISSNVVTALNHHERVFRPYMADIVGNTICADFLDYLRRDAINVGLDVLRDERVLSHFYVCSNSKSEHRMALALVDRRGKPRSDVCTGVVELVRQRYRFAESIYYHKTKVSASAMFAKAMGMIERLTEIPTLRRHLYESEIDTLANELVDNPSGYAGLVSTCLPTALLDAEIGDESLHYLLMNRAFEQIRQQIAGKPRDEHPSNKNSKKLVRNSLSAVALLQGILHRKLYKVAMSIDSVQFGRLTSGVPQGDPEARLVDALHKLRGNDKGDQDIRDQLERKMAEAASWPHDSILLYVPPRKSQAKGIETFAINETSIVPLNEHPAVKQKVEELNRDYQNLWRLLVLVHPDRIGDHTNLSKAVDVLAENLWAICNVTGQSGKQGIGYAVDNAASVVITEACWYPYLERGWRGAADELYKLWSDGGARDSLPLNAQQCFSIAIKTTQSGDTLDATELAERGYLVRRLDSLFKGKKKKLTRDDIQLVILEKFPQKGTLAKYEVSEPVFHFEDSKASPETHKNRQRAEVLNAVTEELSKAVRGRQTAKDSN